MTQTHGGKGSKQRLPSISDDQMAANWGAINWNVRDMPSNQSSTEGGSPPNETQEARGH